jgi:hypothetical protein
MAHRRITSVPVTEVLGSAFTVRWIDRAGSVLRPPRSSDLTPPDSCFRGYVQNYVYMDRIRDPNHLQAKNKTIRSACNKIYAVACMERNVILIGLSGVTNDARVEAYYVQNYVR